MVGRPAVREEQSLKGHGDERSLIASRITGPLGSKRGSEGSAASALSDHFFSASRDSLTRASIFFRQSTSRSLAAAAAAAW